MTLHRDPHFVGGLKYNLVGFPGGPGPEGPLLSEKIDVKAAELYIALPNEHFNYMHVVIQTATGTYIIEIHATGLNPPPKDGDKDNSADSGLVSGINNLGISDVLPPIKRYVPGGPGHVLELSAEIPPAAEWLTKSGVRLVFNPTYFDIIASGVLNGRILWTLKWNQTPSGEENPQLVTVETDRAVQLPPTEIGPGARVSRVVQGYVVYATLLEEGGK
ncbi:hypothetical protein V8F33_006947 [Rhypophila sp. PSN 637]